MDILGSSKIFSVNSKSISTSLEVGHSLQTFKSRFAKALPSLQHCVNAKRNKSINAVLAETKDRLSPNSLLNFGRLSEELTNSWPSIPRSQGGGTRRMSESPSHIRNFSTSPSSVTMGEAVASLEQEYTRASSQEETERMRREVIPLHKLRQSGFVENCLMYRQVFVIRSYEVGADNSSSVDTILSMFQEVALCHVHLLGIAGDGFGATREMNRRGLIWVVTKMQVEVERYPEWPEVIEIDSWVGRAGKNGMRRDWIMRSNATGEVLARATSTWCMMDATTRRLSKIPNEVRAEIDPFFIEDQFAFQEGEVSASRIIKLNDETTSHSKAHLTSCREDLDMNKHVNNLKYISWVLESVPIGHIENHELTSITLEYRRECQSTDIVESLTSSKENIDPEPIHLTNETGNLQVNDRDIVDEHHTAAQSTTACLELTSIDTKISGIACQLTHLLRTTSGQEEILRSRTTWRPRLNQ